MSEEELKIFKLRIDLLEKRLNRIEHYVYALTKGVDQIKSFLEEARKETRID